MWRRGVGAVLGAAAVWAMVLAPQAALAAMEPGAHSSAAVVSVDASTMMTTADAKDADDDTIPDVVEREVCGTATCAVGTEDEDADGIPDWTEVLSCDSTTCASATKDVDKDGIPDFAERLVCDTDTCSNSLEDADSDRIGDWVEFVICGTRTCADGSEDYDGNGVSDASELAACVVRIVKPQNLFDTRTLNDGVTLYIYRMKLPSGAQVWAEVRQGEITNGGVNAIPR